MIKLVSAILTTAVAAGAFCACTPESPPLDPPKVVTTGEPVAVNIKELSTEDQDLYRKAYLNASFELMKRQLGGDQNVMISPASIMIALSMTEAGAAGETRQQMASLWGGTGDDGELNFASELLKRLNESSGVSMHAADSIWLNEDNLTGYIKSEYVDFVKEYYDAEINSLKFDDNGVKRINSWVSEKTDEMINEIVKKFDPDTAMVLINAIAFDGKWRDQYEDYAVREEEFTNSDGTKVKANLMYGSEDAFLENDNATGFIKYYEGGQYAFVVMLPKDESQSADEFLTSFTGDDFDKFINSATYEYEVHTKLPEFKYDYEQNLNDTLQDMGMVQAFEDMGADFTGIASLPEGYNLYISKVIHKTHIDLDRNGTRASAVTAVMMDVAGAVDPSSIQVKEVNCDRPFAYAIVDMTDNTPVFIGTVNNM